MTRALRERQRSDSLPGGEIDGQLAELLRHWDLQPLADLRPCSKGVDNYNYFVDAAEGRYVIACMRVLGAAEIDQILRLLKHLARKGLPVPTIVPTADGRPWLLHGDRPVLVQTRLPGEVLEQPTTAQCGRVGELLASFHGAAIELAHLNGDTWLSYCTRLAERHAPSLPAEQRSLLDEELKALSTPRPPLPSGLLHGDFFRDNLLFSGDDCSGLLDFYCVEMGEYARDIAIALLDWAWLPHEHRFCPSRAEALIDGYRRQRPLSAAELDALPALLRANAVAMWLYRIDRVARGAILSDDRTPADMLQRIQALRQRCPLTRKVAASPLAR